MPSDAPQGSLVDGFDRRIESLRISVTDRCDLRCFYCISDDDIEWLPRKDLLTLEEIGRVARIAVGAGIQKIRITGGEPLLRRNLPHLIEDLSSIRDLEDLALTTNATQLERLAEPLARAGLQRVNISLDSLDPKNFQRLTRRDMHAQVLRGIDAADAAGLRPIRINCVVIAGQNDHEVVDFARLARERAFEVRFIEFMPLEHGTRWGTNIMVPGEMLRKRIADLYPLRPDPNQSTTAPSRDWLFEDGAPGLVGFINSVTEPFCASCDRIRLTADGKLRTCLFSLTEHDLMALVRGGASDSELTAFLHAVVGTKEKKHHITDGMFEKPVRTMSQIGG